MLVFFRVVLHCALCHVLLVRCSDPLLQMVFNSEDSSTVMGAISELKETRGRMECIASCIVPKCSAVIMEVCSKSNSACQLNSVYCQHVQMSTAYEITLGSGQELWSVGNYEVGSTQQNETTTKTVAATTQNYATTTAATLNDEVATTAGNSDTTLIITSSNEESSTAMETATMADILTAETTISATTPMENADTTPATAVTQSITRSEETSTTAETTTATMTTETLTTINGTLKENSTSNEIEQRTSVAHSDTTNATVVPSTSSEIAQSKDTTAAVEPPTTTAAMTAQATTLSLITGSENGNSTSNAAEDFSKQLTTTENYDTTITAGISTLSDVTQNEESSAAIETTSTLSAMVTETTVTLDNENSVSGTTGQHTSQLTAAESSNTTFAASTSPDITPNGETTPATSTMANVIATDSTVAEIATTENENSMTDGTGQSTEQFSTAESFEATPTTTATSTSSETTRNWEVSVSMETTTMATEKTTNSGIITTEHENSMSTGTEQFTTIESSFTGNQTTVSTMSNIMTTETTTTVINASESENATSNTTECLLGYENWWGNKCYRLEDTAIRVYQTASEVCINDTAMKSSHLLHGIGMTQEELDAINGRLTEGMYWVAVKHDTDDSVWQWQRPGQDGITLNDQDVLYWLNRTLPLEGVGECGVYNTTSQALQAEDCETTLPYICQYINEED